MDDPIKRIHELEEKLYWLGFELGYLGLNTEDIKIALGGPQGIKIIEERVNKQWNLMVL